MRTVLAEGGEGLKMGALKREVECMRGRQEAQVTRLTFVDLEARVLADRPLRAIKALGAQAWERITPSPAAGTTSRSPDYYG